jgi:hypothetical protein
MYDHTVGADRRTHPHGVQHRLERLRPDILLGRGQVDQVDGVDDDRLDRPVGHQRPELGDVVVLPARRPPHARRLIEDLHRVAAHLGRAAVRGDKAARCRDVSAY